MGQTPKFLLPYPEPTDKPQGDLQIKALAAAVEARGEDGSFTITGPGASLTLSSDFVPAADNQFKLADAGFLNGAQIVDGTALKVASTGLWVFSGVLNISSAVAAAYPLEGDIWIEWDATASILFTERVSFYARAGGGEPPGHQSFQFTIPLKAQDTVRIKFKIFGRVDDLQLNAAGMLLASEVMQQQGAML